MAEIFGAVASGAGLVSLAIQLLESSQRLKGFYNASRDAPQAVADLSFELHTMSLSLRQLESHRRGDILGDELLGRCIFTCSNMVKNIETALGKMERLLHKSRKMGGMYTAFKEPEIRKLLEDLEQAKSSMLFAYMSYCQSYNIHEASSRAATVLAQNALLSSHELHLQNLDRTIQSGHAAILSHVRSSQPQLAVLSRTATSSVARFRVQSQTMLPARRSRPKYRFGLPRWFTDTVWEFGVCDTEGGWIFQLHPINIRPRGSFVFKAWSFAERFFTAVNSAGWPAKAFVELICPDNFTQLAISRDNRGKTALHWAAEHLGYWRCPDRWRGEYDTSLLESYAELAAKLVTMGADLHALNSTGQTPFSCMLQGRFWCDSQPWRSWGHWHLADAVRRWGRVVVDSGCSLETYVVRENLLLGRSSGHVCKLRIYDIPEIKMYRLTIPEASELVLEVECARSSQLWEFHPPPGAWLQTTYQIDRIHWEPTNYYEGDNHYLWQAADYIEGPSKLMLVGQQPNIDRLPRLFSYAWREWITGAQDDHGFVATKSRTNTGVHVEHKRRQRAASLPPPRMSDDNAPYNQIDSVWLGAGWARRVAPMDCKST